MLKLEQAVKMYALEGVHPLANLFPLMQEAEFKGLCEDAEKNGFMHSAKITKDLELEKIFAAEAT